MKSLYLQAPHQLEWIEEDKRNLQPDEVQVETVASAMSIGTELPQYEGRARQGYATTYPTMTGYENVGRIVEVGSVVDAVTVGQRVIAFYGYRTHAIVNWNAVIPVDDDISDRQALLAILSCDVAKGIRKLQPHPEETVLVTGGGAIGLLTVYVLAAYGVRRISIVEPLEPRRQLALKLGAQVAITPEAMGNHNASYHLGMECSSYQRAFALLQSKVMTNGRIAVLADGNREPLTLTPDFHQKELTLYASSDGWDYAKHAEWFFDVVRNSTKPLEQLFDVTIRAQDIPDTFAALSKRELSAIKVFITDFS